ncbi:glycerophosphodiester phosphodiesterase [Pseudoalteromonas piscicida]|uniref:Glycerophosphodiester phosphodiesterase n=1 Tax=Pseudoalteromonas piscicida TaxID=43662 RepID=A0A2A5JPA8_PSEO7|nr:glycerophosphodiester phosphodiesterase [Pseudoalteromonas piscicida]PCK31304.1 glycerophosphodiester phosphodiesterase [Pseudoalteromonas piscicida]
MSVSSHHSIFFITFFILLLAGCNSSPDTTHSNVKPVDPEVFALNQAFEARGFYRTSLGNINFLHQKQCGNYQLQSHRGSIRYPENSLNAVIDALDNGFDVVEVDVQVTSDGVWVVHHDKRTGRETGTVDNKRRRIERINYKKEWGYLRTRDQQSGQLLDVVPPNFRQLANIFAQSAGNGQLLNIEIKSDATKSELEMLDFLAFKTIGQGRYFYSSLTLRNLERMRDINAQVFLSFIQSPAKRSMEVLKAKLEKGVASDNLYQDNQETIENIAGFGLRRYRERRYDSHQGIKKLTKALRRNFGLAIDIRQYAEQSSRTKTLVKSYQLPVATYTINGQHFHSKLLKKIGVSSRPDSVIIDDTIYGFCTQYGVPAQLDYSGSTVFTRRLATLPADLDLERLSEVDTYFNNGLYPALGGILKSINGSATSHNYTPVMLTPKAGPKERESKVNLETNQAIEVELREGKR